MHKHSQPEARSSFPGSTSLTLGLLIIAVLSFFAANPPVCLPRVSHAPNIGDFDGMAPHGNALELPKITEFIQQSPSDGQPASKRTDVFMGYDENNIYFVWPCFDDPRHIRPQLQRREATFHDQRHAFVFDVNPMGVQADALWLEANNSAD